MGGSVLASMSSLYSHVAWHMHIQSQFRWTLNTDNKQVLQCPQKHFSTQNSHLRSFSWKFFQRSVRSCAATPGVLSASLRTGEIFGEKAHLPTEKRCEPGSRCTFPSLQRSYWQHWASISGTISFTPVQGRTWQAGCFSHDLRQQVTSYQTDHMEDWDNISKKAFKCLCISDPQGYCDRFWCILMFWNLQMEFWMAEVLIEGIKPFALLSGIVLRRCVWARCPCMKAPNSTSLFPFTTWSFGSLALELLFDNLFAFKEFAFHLIHQASHDISIHFPMPDVTGPFSGVPSTIYSLAPLRSLVWRISLRFAAGVPGWRGCNWWWW